MYEIFGQGDEPVKVADLQPVLHWAGSPQQCLSLPIERGSMSIFELNSCRLLLSNPNR